VNKKHILVFGASGFIGTYLIDALIAEGYQVTASDIADESRDFYSGKSVDFVKVDITRKEDFDRLEHRAYEAVVHLAACQPANVAEQKYDPRDYINVNVIGTLNILDFCRDCCASKIIYASSHRNTQGLWAPNRAITEEEGRAVKYDGEYAMFSISESAAQDCVLHYQAEYGLPGILFRLPPVYGYGPHTEIFKDGKPIKTGFQIFIDKAIAGEPLEVWGDSEIGRDIIYVKDVVHAFLQAIKLDGISGLYNITSGSYLTLRDQAETIARTFWGGLNEPAIVYRPEIENGMDAFLYDNSKARRDLDWSPQYNFHAMLLDYQNEAKTEKYRYLVNKRLKMFNLKDKEMEEYTLEGIELMGENVRDKLRSCGEGVRIYPMAKIAFPHVVDLAANCRIRDFAFIFAGEGVKIGEYTDVQPHTVIWGGGLTIIGDRVSTGPGTVFLSATYSHAAGLKMVDGMEEGETAILGGRLEVGNDVYIGARSVIMPVKIGEGCVIGAGSFVNKDCEPWGIYVGSPAKRIGERPRL